MEGIRQWAFSVCVALVACGIAQLMLPKAGLEKIFRLTVSVFLLCCLLSPIAIQMPQISLQSEEYSEAEIQRRSQQLLEELEKQSEQAAAGNLEKIIRDKLAGMGINPVQITINIKTNGQNESEVESVEILLEEKHRIRHDSIVAELKQAYDLPFRLGYVQSEGNEG